MSGICGIAHIDTAQPVNFASIVQMRTLLTHRGPDDVGHYLGAGVGLGYCCLKLERNNSHPASSDRGDIHLILDGEIYNEQELRDELTQRGHQLRGRSPAEILVRSYQVYGIDFLKRLNGMFAIALHDVPRRRVVLARDPMGVKPLFYEVTDTALVFGSEIKAVLAGTGRPATFKQSALQEFLIFRYIAGERSFFDGVSRLLPGHTAIWEAGTLRLQRYWTLPAHSRLKRLSDTEAAGILSEHMREAVGSQLTDGAPLGAFCSGGIDSGLITGYAATGIARQLPTFSAGFQNPAWDETRLALNTATRFGTDHRVLVVEPEEVRSSLPALIWHNDEPLGHPNAVAIYLLGKLARESVEIVLAGEGADELFGGYPRYHIVRLQRALSAFPRWGTSTLAKLMRVVPGHRAARLTELLPLSFEDSLIFNSAYVDPNLVAKLTGAPIADALSERRVLLSGSIITGDPVASISRYELLTYLGSALDRLDRMVMANSLEARLPFLDLRIVNWACNLCSSKKMRGRQNKLVVKHMAQSMLSPQITSGQKSGFGLPLADWFRSQSFSDLVASLLDPAHPAATLFDHQILRQIVQDHMSGTVDHSEILWLLVNIYLWHEVQVSG